MNAPANLFERFPVIDVDTHLTEPPDVWVGRVSSKWGDLVPHIERIDGRDLWMAGGNRIGSPGATTMAGWRDVLPDSPPTYEDLPKSAYDPKERIAHMDALGIQAQVLYPNVGGFGAGYFSKLSEPEFALECVRAYNDFLHEWTAVAPNRLLSVAALPFWDVDVSVAEIERCAEMGFRAINFCNQPDTYGQPVLSSRHWDPIWATARDTGLPISFHIGGGDIGALMRPGEMGFRANFGRVSSLLFVDNMRCIADLTFGGVCHRFPDVKFVSVESGVGWVPGGLEAMDWQWRNSGVAQEHPEYELVPSEYFRRQIYACFWFEREAAVAAIHAYPDNVLYETDFPHPTCQHPGPATSALYPAQYATEALSSLSDAQLRKVLFDNAAELYKVPDPAVG